MPTMQHLLSELSTQAGRCEVVSVSSRARRTKRTLRVMFGYADAVIERYPAIQAGVIRVSSLANGPSSPELLRQYRAEQEAVADRLEGSAIADLPSIAAWRRAFAAFGAKPTQYRSAPEALLRRLTKQGEIPSINALVDIANLVSIRYAVPVAAFDLAGIDPPITVRFAEGDERFTDLGSSESVHPEPSEVVFVDRQNVVCARRWCWRQSAQSATSESTTEALVVIEALHPAAEPDVEAALADLSTLLGEHQPDARADSFRLSAAAPSIGEGSPGVHR